MEVVGVRTGREGGRRLTVVMLKEQRDKELNM